MRKLIYSTAVLVFLIMTGTGKSQVLWRGAKTMKKGSFITMAQVYYMDYSKKYIDGDWTSNPNDQSNFGFEFMFGHALSDRWEIMLHAPVSFKSCTIDGDKDNSSGICDLFLKTRYALIPWAKDKHGITLTGSLRFATGSDEEGSSFLNLGDGTKDIGIGGMFTSAWLNKFKGHIKLNYWLNGTNDTDINIGDELKLILKIDFNMSSKVMPFATFIYYSKYKNKDADDNEVAGSDKTRKYFVIGGVYKPVSGIFLRPKLSFFLGGKNGVIFSAKPMFDFWYVF